LRECILTEIVGADGVDELLGRALFEGFDVGKLVKEGAVEIVGESLGEEEGSGDTEKKRPLPAVIEEL